MTILDKRWYLFRFNQAREDVVRQKASSAGIEVIAPKVAAWRKRGRDRKERRVIVPAFHSYLILGFEGVPDYTRLHRSVRPVMMTTVTGELAMARIRDSEIEGIRSNRFFRISHASLETLAVPDPNYTHGELLRIFGGVFSGYEGRVASINKRARSCDLSMDGPISRVTVSYDYLERTEERVDTKAERKHKRPACL